MGPSRVEPEAIHVSTPRLQAGPDGWRLSATLTVDLRAWEVWFHSAEAELACAVEPFVALALPAAMHLRRRLVVEGEVSPRLLAQLPELQRIWIKKEPLVGPAALIAAAGVPQPQAQGREAALFFSCGVDSFHSLLEHQSELTALIFVDGFDVSLNNRALYAEVWQNVRETAAGFGKRLIRVETNLRQFTDSVGDWGYVFHGPAKGAVGLALAPTVGRCFVSGERLRPETRESSCSELDPLWSSEAVEMIHVGNTVGRFEKLRRISADPYVQRQLRVCWDPRTGRYNCGECSKCLRNMAALRALGRLEAVATFGAFQPKRLEQVVRIDGHLPYTGILDIIHHLREHGQDPELLRVLERMVSRRAWALRHPRMHRALQFCRALPARAGRKLARLRAIPAKAAL